MAIDHTRAGQESLAASGQPGPKEFASYTYKEICAEIGLHWRAARYFLGVIQRHCRVNGLPPLQFLAANAASRLPGRGCVGSPRTDAAQQEALRAIYAYPWPAKPPF